jgi:hypothetical protein
VTGGGPVLLGAAYAGLLWAVALGLDAIGRRALRPRGRVPAEEPGLGGDVARFHRAMGGAVLGAGGFLLVALALARRDLQSLLLIALAAGCASGALRRLAPMWREP